MANLTTWAYIQHENRTHITSVRGKYLSHLTSWTKAPREGIEPAVLKNFSFYRLYQLSLTYPESFFFVLCKKDEPTRLRRDGLEPSTLAYEASKLPLLYPAVGVVGLGPDDKSIKGRLLYQLSYTPIVQQQHDRLRSRRYRLTIFRSFKKGIPFLLFLKCNEIVFLCNHNSLVQMLLSINYHRSNFLKDFIELYALVFELCNRKSSDT